MFQPDTLLRWYRELFQLYWRRKSQGKPKITSETTAGIEKMAEMNPLWIEKGYQLDKNFVRQPPNPGG